MQLEEIRELVNRIRLIKDNSKSAHLLEDFIYLSFVRFISTSDKVSVEIQGIAKEVLKTRDIDFPRYTE